MDIEKNLDSILDKLPKIIITSFYKPKNISHDIYIKIAKEL